MENRTDKSDQSEGVNQGVRGIKLKFLCSCCCCSIWSLSPLLRLVLMVCHVKNVFNWTQLIRPVSSLNMIVIGQWSRVTEGEVAACVGLLWRKKELRAEDIVGVWNTKRRTVANRSLRSPTISPLPPPIVCLWKAISIASLFSLLSPPSSDLSLWSPSWKGKTLWSCGVGGWTPLLSSGWLQGTRVRWCTYSSYDSVCMRDGTAVNP